MLELVSITKRYGTNLALNDLSLQVNPGQMYGFVGPNGAGKSTAMRVTLGITAADSGEVRWRGEPVTRETVTRFGYMPEERGLYAKMKVREQLIYLARLHGCSKAQSANDTDQLLETLGLSHRGKDNLETLSLGNQQRVQLAASLVHSPELLVLDEPFSGLDPKGVDALAAILEQRCAAGAAVIFSSHQLELVERLCETVGILAAGHLVATGTVKSLRSTPGRTSYRLRVIDASPDWLDAIPEAVVVSTNGDGLHLDLPEDFDSQMLLDEARKAGHVETFDVWRPTLAELFRDVVPS